MCLSHCCTVPQGVLCFLAGLLSLVCIGRGRLNTVWVVVVCVFLLPPTTICLSHPTGCLWWPGVGVDHHRMQRDISSHQIVSLYCHIFLMPSPPAANFRLSNSRTTLLSMLRIFFVGRLLHRLISAGVVETSPT